MRKDLEYKFTIIKNPKMGFVLIIQYIVVIQQEILS